MNEDDFGLGPRASWKRTIDAVGEDKIAAFIAEPIQGAGGVIIPPATYWPEISRICAERDILLIVDEVITGFGRTGNWFGSETYGIRARHHHHRQGASPPAISRSAASPFPTASPRFHERGQRIQPRLHLFRPSGLPARCPSKICRSSTRKGSSPGCATKTAPYLAKRWRALAEHALVGEARIKGMMGAIELTPDKPSRAKFAGEEGRIGTHHPRVLLRQWPRHASRRGQVDHLAAADALPRGGRRTRRAGGKDAGRHLYGAEKGRPHRLK